MALVTSLFFMWGFLTVMNDILIPYLKEAFELNYFQAMLVQFAFFMAYFVGSVIYFMISVSTGDPIGRMGYQKGIVIGLVISGVGGLLFYPAAVAVSYPIFLCALFVLALGFTMLQISANPYVAILGPESSASARLNLSQGFNSLGTTVGPLLGAILIYNVFGGLEGVDSVRAPYLFFAGILLALALVFALIRLPRVIQNTQPGGSMHSLRYPHVLLGMLAIFFYVGAEVSIGSMLINYLSLPEIAGLDESQGSVYVAIYWGGLMIGRFMGAISLNRRSMAFDKLWQMAVIALICFGVIFGGIVVKEFLEDRSFAFGQIAPFLILIALNYGAFLLGRSLPQRTLMIFALVCIALLITTTTTSGALAMWSVLGIGLFNSIMWSNIFTLAIEGLGEHKSQASSLLVMMIIGGALLPPLQGLIADAVGEQLSFLLPITAYLYLAYYGWRGYMIRPPMGAHTSHA